MDAAPLILQIQRLEPAATLPTKGHASDLGWDLYALDDTTVAPGALVGLRTGIAVGFPPGVGGLIRDRSSLASRGLMTLAGVIDPDYRGEIRVLVTNVGDDAVTVAAGDRCAQMILVRTLAATAVEADDLDATARGAGGFGSTGR